MNRKNGVSAATKALALLRRRGTEFAARASTIRRRGSGRVTLGRPFHLARVIGAFTLAIPLLSCGKYGPFGQCPEGQSISDRVLVNQMIEKLVRQSQANRRPDEIQYRSVQEFMASNPDCCFIERPEGYSGKNLELPFRTEVQAAIIYRRSQTGDKPYELRRVAAGPCPSDMEESGHSMTPEEYKASKTWKWNWKVE